MYQIIIATFKGFYRDRVFKGIALSAASLFLIPSISELSMRQVVELSITLLLSLVSAITLLLSVFLGGSSLWKDTERRYTYSVLGLPFARTTYLFGKFIGVVLFLFLTSLVLGSVGCIVVKYVSIQFPPARHVAWINLFLALLFVALKYILLVSCAFLLSTISTSFFLPIFGTLAVFFAGNASQQVYDYLRSAPAQSYAPFVKNAVSFLYYILPNFSAFDLSVNAIYAIPVSVSGLVLTTVYFFIYTTTILTLAAIIFTGRELQ